MFDFIRHHTKLFMVVLFVLVFPAFALWGIGGYSRMGSTAKVAVVDGQPITQADWDQAHRERTELVRRSNPQLNLAVLDTPQMRYDTLEGLVRDRVLAVAAHKQRLLVSDVALAQALQSDPVIASLRKDDGTLDMAAYERLAAQQGLTPQGFEASVRASRYSAAWWTPALLARARRSWPSTPLPSGARCACSALTPKTSKTR